jgi:hypothetical protein
MFITIFVCIGFMLAILYIDLMFDVMAVPHRRSGAALPKDVLDPITHYYRRVTQNPYVLMFVMLTTTIFLVLQIVYGLAPRWAAYASLAAMGLAMVAGIVKVIPTAQRLASGKDSPDVQTRLIHGVFTAHALLLVCILALAALQLVAAGRGTPYDRSEDCAGGPSYEGTTDRQVIAWRPASRTAPRSAA